MIVERVTHRINAGKRGLTKLEVLPMKTPVPGHHSRVQAGPEIHCIGIVGNVSFSEGEVLQLGIIYSYGIFVAQTILHVKVELYCAARHCMLR